jgi:hypothetical protein
MFEYMGVRRVLMLILFGVVLSGRGHLRLCRDSLMLLVRLVFIVWFREFGF